jgi:hypothetical protein
MDEQLCQPKQNRYHLFDVMRQLRLFRNAFNEVFIDGGIARLMARIRKAEGLN